jgi:hypothetical protein
MFRSFRESIARYLQLRITSVKLELIDRLSNAMGYFAFILIVAFLFFFSFLFFSFGLAAWLGELFHNRYAGLFCTGGIILVIAFITIALGKPIIQFFAGKLAAILLLKKEQEQLLDEEEE